MTNNSKPPIVVGIDGSTSSLAALRWAMREGRQSDAPVHVVHCWQPQNLTEYVLVAPHSFARASVCMLDNEIAAALAEMEVKPDVQPISIHGRPATALLNVADGAAMLRAAAIHEPIFRTSSSVTRPQLREARRLPGCRRERPRLRRPAQHPRASTGAGH